METPKQGAPIKKRKAVEVVVFQEPGKKSRTDKDNVKSKWKKRKSNRDEKEKEDFKSIFQDVKEFGVTGFSKKDRKKYEEKKAQELGARKPKGQKVPYPILQYAVKVRKEREKERIEMDKAMGIFNKKKKERKDRKKSAHGGWWVNEPVNIDKSSNNIKIKSSDLKVMQKKK